MQRAQEAHSTFSTAIITLGEWLARMGDFHMVLVRRYVVIIYVGVPSQKMAEQRSDVLRLTWISSSLERVKYRMTTVHLRLVWGDV